MAPIFLSLVSIILISVASGVVLIGVLIILHFTVFAHMRAKKNVRELSRRFEYLHALLFGQDSQYIKRIENISRGNLLYVNTHLEFSKRFKEIRDKADASAQWAVNNLKNLLSEGNYPELKIALPKAKETIDSFDEQVNALNDDLLVVIKPEEECRHESLLLKEELRKIKQDYYVKQADLTLVSSSFDRVFKLLDGKFADFETLVESAQYEEAEAILPLISKIIKELGNDLKELPNLCVSIQTIIPDKIASLQNHYEEMIRAEYPLHHLLVQDNIDQMQNQLSSVSNRVMNFDLAGANNELSAILAKIDEIFSSFEKEKDARVVFESECDKVYATSALIEKKYIRLCNALPNVKKIYAISDEEQANIDGIKNFINIAGAAKRSLDTFIHSNTRQPYSLLLDKMHTLSGETDRASGAIDDFDRYLLSLKGECEDSASKIAEHFDKLKDDEVYLRRINIPSISDKYMPEIDRLYGVLDEANKTLHHLPIDVAKVTSLVKELSSSGAALNSAIKEEYEKMEMADAVILFGNRDRMSLSDVSVPLLQAEGLYMSGNFEMAYEEANSALKRIRGE